MAWLIDSLKKSFAGVPDFPYAIGEPVEAYNRTQDCKFWQLVDGTRNEDQKEVSIFIFDKKTAPGNHVQAAVNCFKYMKKFITHPQMLKFECGVDLADKMYIATEKVLPLGAYIDGVVPNAKELHQDGFIELGIHQLCEALDFMNNQQQIVHGCIHPGSVFVNKAGTWKLGNFLLTHKFQEAGPEIKTNLNLLPERYHPKELIGGFAANISSGTVNSIDSWCVGCLIFEVFNKRFSSPRQLTTFGSIPDQVLKTYKRILATKPSSRASVTTLLQNDYLAKNTAVRALGFIDEISIKSEDEKQNFYKKLSKFVALLPESCSRYRVLPALLNQLQFGSGSNPVLFTVVLQLSAKLEEEEREKMVVPVVTKMFSNNERSTRINLLKNLKTYVEFIPSKLIEQKIFPEVLSGFGDSTPALREVSVRSLIYFAPKLDPATLNDKVLKILAKCQTDVEPAIRTNTTVVIGEIAQHLNKDKQEAILAPAFVKTLKDKFMPARKAAVIAIDKTLEIFSMRQLVNAILPALGRAAVDPYEAVRKIALKTLNKVIKRISQHAKSMPKEPVQKTNIGELPNDKAKQDSNASASTLNALSSGVGWMASAFSSKLGKGDASPSKSDEDFSSRMGEIKNPTFKSPPSETKKVTKPKPKPKRKEKPKMTADDDLDALFDTGDDDYDDMFASDKSDDLFSLSKKKKKPAVKTKKKSSRSSARRGSKPKAPRFGNKSLGTNPFELEPSKKSKKTNNWNSSNNDDIFDLLGSQNQSTPKSSANDDFGDLFGDMSSKKSAPSSGRKKKKKREKKKTPIISSNEDDLDDLFDW